ncbi:HEPN domain-containing protein [Novosphingobium sp.]|uniref:nucleotidyltransferase and HEPN domain-containing protein n=1 Tax=Novosphingobium sp. TaxID=1874826 RepID=UPI0028A6591B|nr:HEPN domain-containing protein [Novosphingobium sp.]
MKTDLGHLSGQKQSDLDRIVQIIFSEFDDLVARATQPWKRRGRILSVILYGAYAAPDWDACPMAGHAWDYDVLVVVNHERLADEVAHWRKAKAALAREHSIAKRISALPNLIVHSLEDFTRQLGHGGPFFVDVLRKGIALYQCGSMQFEPPRKLDRDELRLQTQQLYNQWFDSAKIFLDMADFALSRGANSHAAFLLHQAAEQSYQAILAVKTLHCPLSHHLKFLRGRAENVARDLIPIWPREDKFARRCFELLHLAYIKGRYSPHYAISDAELDWTFERVQALQTAVQAIAEKQISEL